MSARIWSGDVDGVRFAVEALRRGQLVGLPTETVYGLAADARNEAAIRRVFAAKGRPADHPLIVHLHAFRQLSVWVREVPAAARQLADAFWPGPLTLVLQRRDGVSPLITGGQDSIAVRVPAHPLARALLAAFGDGLVAPSANRFGRISPTCAAHVADELGDAVGGVLDGGDCPVGIESTIVSLLEGTPRILRPGSISAEAIGRVLGTAPDWGLVHVSETVTQLIGGDRTSQAADHAGSHRVRAVAPAPERSDVPSDGAPPSAPSLASQAAGHVSPSMPRVSGALAAHYAPATPMQLCEESGLAAAIARVAPQDRVCVWAPAALRSQFAGRPPETLIWRDAPADPARYAAMLYATLRALDAHHAARIVVTRPPHHSDWLAIHDRLGRAAQGAGAGHT